MGKGYRADLSNRLLCPGSACPGREKPGTNVNEVLARNPCLGAEERRVCFGEMFAKLHHGKLHMLITSYLFLFNS